MNNDPLGTGNFISGRMPGYKSRPQTPVQKKKGFWKDQISTGGQMGGAAGGAALGAAAGSVVPGIGTLIGGLAGAILGGATGGFAGQRYENAIVGDDLNKDVAKEAALGGAFAVGPIRGASILAKGGKALATGTGLREGVEQGITATPIRSAISNKFGKGMEQSGQRLLGTQANLTRADIRKLGPDGAPATVLGGINATTGLRSLDDMAEVGSNVTGKNGVLSELSRNAIGNSPGTDLGDLRTVAEDLLVNQAPLVSDSTRKNILQQVQNSVVKSYGGSQGSLSTLANPLDAFDAARSFEGMAAKIRTSPTKSPADEQLANVYSGLAKDMKDRLFSAPGVNEGVELARKDAFDKFMNLADIATSKAQREAYQKLAHQTSGLQDVASIRSAQAPFVKLGKIEEKTAAAEAGAGARLSDQAQGLGKLIQKPLNLLAMPVDAATPRVAGMMTKAGGSLKGLGGNGTGVNPLGAAGRTGAVGTLESAMNAVPEPTFEEDMDEIPEADIAGYYGLNEEAAIPGEEQTPASEFGVTSAQVAQEMILALQEGDRKGYADLKDLYKLVKESEKGTGKGGYNSTTAASLAMSENGISTLSQLENLYKQTGGGSGKVGGFVKSKMGEFGMDDSAASYEALASSSTSQLAKAINGGGQVSDADAAALIRALPRITDSPQVAATKFAALKERLARARQNTESFNSTN